MLDAISKPGLDYKSVLELDRRIRDFAVPLPLRNKEKCASRNLALQRASMGTAVEAGELFRPSINSRQLSTVKCQSTILILQLVLLQLHRSYFIRALSGPEEAFNRRHKYAPSVVAVFLSASRMIATIQELFQKEPELTSRILWYWSNAFSAAVSRQSLLSAVILIGGVCRSLCVCWYLERLLLVCHPRPYRICKGQGCCSELGRRFVLELLKFLSVSQS